MIFFQLLSHLRILGLKKWAISEFRHVIEILSQFESEPSQNLMHMPSRDNISFVDVLSHINIAPVFYCFWILLRTNLKRFKAEQYWSSKLMIKKLPSAKQFVFKVYWSSFILPVKPNPIQKLILVSQSIDRDCTVWSSQWFINYEWRSSACMIDNLKSQLVTLTESTRKTGFWSC